jgi:SNF family Na+-dependent transporter
MSDILLCAFTFVIAFVPGLVVGFLIGRHNNDNYAATLKYLSKQRQSELWTTKGIPR